MGKFKERVYESVRKIPLGKVASYGEVARAAGSPKACRAVGNILHKNPLPGIIPCHRVVHSNGKCAAAFAFGGEGQQRELLENEGVLFTSDGRVDMKTAAIIIPNSINLS